MNPPMSNLIAKEIRTRQLTYREAAPLFSKSYQCVSQWVNGETQPTDTTLLNLINSPHQWVSDLAFRCLVLRYPVIVQLLAARANQET